MDSGLGHKDFVKLQRSREDGDLVTAVRDVWRREASEASEASEARSSLAGRVHIICEDGDLNIPGSLLPLLLPRVSLSQHQEEDLVILTPSITKDQLSALLDLLLTGESSAVHQSLVEVEDLFRTLGFTSVQIELVQRNTGLKSKPKLGAEKRSSEANVNFQESIRILSCGVCGVRADNFYPVLKKHYELEHFNSTENGFLCPMRGCNKKILSSSSFHSHIHIVHREPQFRCESCLRSFKTWTGLSHHRTRWHSDSRSLHCEICGEGLATVLHRESHMRMHRSRHVCALCNKKFLSAAHLKKHQITHTKDRPFVCQTCFKTFRDKYSADQCQLRHQGLAKLKPSARVPWSQREMKFVCDICGYKTRGAAPLNRHIRGQHSADTGTVYECPDCGKQFKSSSSLLSHKSGSRSKCYRDILSVKS